MGIHGIFLYYAFYTNWQENTMHAACDTQMASQTHFPQTYIKQA